MVNIFNHMDNFIFVISPNRKIKFANKTVLKRINIDLKDIVDTPVKDCLYSNGRSIDNLINSLEKNEDINFDFYLEIGEKKYFFNGDLLEDSFYGESSYFIIARDVCEKYYKREDLESLLDTINMNCFIKNQRGEYLYVNKKKCDSHNKTKEEIIGHRTTEFFNVKESEYIEKIEGDVIKRKEPFCSEKRLTFNGKKIWYELTVDDTLNEDGSVKNIVGNSRNIDIRKHLNKTLDYTGIKFRKINKFLNEDENDVMNLLDYISEKTLMHFHADGIAIVFYKEKENDFYTLVSRGVVLDDFNFDYTEKREVFEDSYTRYSKRLELEGIKYVDEIKNEIVAKKLKEKNIYKIGIYNIAIGKKILGHIIITFLQDTKPIEYGYDYIKTICSHLAVTISNINESKKIKEELKEYKQKREYLQKCIEISVDIVGKFDKDGKLIYINAERLKSILGWNIKELKDQSLYNIMDIKDREILYKQIQNGNDSTIHMESKFMCKNGEFKWLECNIKQYKNENSFFFTARDITHKKEYQKKEKLLEEAVQLESLKNRFFNNISHEFRTPINIILGTVQLIEKYRQNENYTLEYLDYHINFIKKNSYRLLRLVQNLLDLSQIESEYYDTNFGNYDIVNIVEDITMSVATYLENKDVHLIFDTDCEEQVICCDPEKIERIILNLLSNAIKYNKDNNDIEVCMFIDDDFVKIYIKDHGIGIEKEELKTIFEEFKKVDDGLTRPCEGSGIGLSIVNEFVRLHKGYVSVDSEVGVGSTFEVTLPNRVNSSDIESRNSISSDNIMRQSKIERCNIEFSDIYN